MRKPIYHEQLQDVVIRPVELPEVTFLETTETSRPLNAAAHQEVPVDLSKYGYVEEEFIVSGYANVYEYHDVGLLPKIRCENGRYSTRILVRRPANQEKQSGFAILEVFNYAGPENAFAGWGYCSEYMMAHGDVWVGITIKQKPLDRLMTFDPERYKGLGFPNPVPADKRRKVAGPALGGGGDDIENGLAYDAMSQVAALLKTPNPANPLFRNGRGSKAAKYVLGMGASGCDMSLYAAALQNISIMEGGKPCYDGFHIHMTGYPGSISNGEARFDADDDRCKIMTNVPLVWTQTMGDMRGGGIHPSYSYMYRWPDSNLPGRQHRQYEIAGSPLTGHMENAFKPCAADITRSSGTEEPVPDLSPDGEIPHGYVVCAVLHALKRWVGEGIPAPKSAYIEMAGEYPDADFVLDENGNPIGGVRLPQIEVPTATYTYLDNPCTGHNIITPFSPEKLRALYPTHADYFAKFVKAAMKLVADGYLLPEHAEKLILEAYEAKIPE